MTDLVSRAGGVAPLEGKMTDLVSRAGECGALTRFQAAMHKKTESVTVGEGKLTSLGFSA